MIPRSHAPKRLQQSPGIGRYFHTPRAQSPLAYCDADQLLLLLASLHNALLPTCWFMTCPTSRISRPDSLPAYKSVRTVCLLAHRSLSALPLTNSVWTNFQLVLPVQLSYPPSSHRYTPAMQPGTRVVFWEDAGKMKHGCVQSIGLVDVRVSLATVTLSRLS
jgi:hypothetical protein